MIHAIYFRSRAKNKWSLFSITQSAEAATKELQVATQEAQKGGNELGEAVIQVFDSSIFIPELLNEIKDRKALGFN
jgi:hypothetical protein